MFITLHGVVSFLGFLFRDRRRKSDSFPGEEDSLERDFLAPEVDELLNFWGGQGGDDGMGSEVEAKSAARFRVVTSSSLRKAAESELLLCSSDWHRRWYTPVLKRVKKKHFSHCRNNVFPKYMFFSENCFFSIFLPNLYLFSCLNKNYNFRALFTPRRDRSMFFVNVFYDFFHFCQP